MSAPRNWARLPTPDPWGPSRAEDVAGRFQAWLYARLKERFVRGEIDAEQFAAELQRLFSKRAPSASVRAAMFAGPQAPRRRRDLRASAAFAVPAVVAAVAAVAVVGGVEAPSSKTPASGAARPMSAAVTPLPTPRPPAPPAYTPRSVYVPAPPAPPAAPPTAAALPQAAGPAPAATSPSAAWPGRQYTVQGGDTLSAIARRHNTTVDALVAANHLRSRDVTLAIGQKLIIP